MEILMALAGVGVVGLALLLQAKPLPSEDDFKKAKAKLEINILDPDANMVVGKYLAFVLGDYSGAMPYLIHSPDKTLKTLAEHELDEKYTDTAIKKIGMGDEWVTAAKNFKPLNRIFYERASSQWYALAWPDLDGVWKDKLRERLKKLLTVSVPGGALKKGTPAGWTFGPDTLKVFTDPTIAHIGGKSARLDGGKEKISDGSSWITTPLLVAPKGNVTLSAWVASDGTDNSGDRLIINFVDETGKVLSRPGPFIPMDSPFWQKVEVKLDIPKNVVRVSVGVLFFSSKGTLWVDDVSLKFNDKELLENGSFEK